MKSLYVFFEDQKVGVLTKNDDDIFQFIYDSFWTKFPLSLSMPIGGGPFGNKVSKAYFENLLPEGDVRKNLETSQKVSGVFDFLDHYGKDCAGAIVISNSPELPPKGNVQAKVPIEMDMIYAGISHNQSSADILAELNPGYLSLAGAQDKFPAIYENGEFYLPTEGGPTTHIVKTPIRRNGVKESVFNEYFSMKLADLVGLKVPFCEVVIGKEPLFVIERYDRKLVSNGQIERLHQQDFCQAYGILSDSKYESTGGPNIVQNYNLILDSVTGKNKFSAIETYLDWLCFNLILGNNDCHSKNISFLLTDDGLQLAPFYDLLCTAVYTRIKSEFAFSVGGRHKYSEMGARQYTDLEEALAIKPGTFVKKLTRMYHLIFDFKEIALMDAETEFPTVKIFRRIDEVIQSRLKNLHRHNIIMS